MNRTIVSLAIIKSHWEHNKSDYIDNFIPLTASLIKEKNYSNIDLQQFQDDFKKKYGLIIPINAIITILNRAKKKKIVYRKHGNTYVNKKNLSKYDISIVSKGIEREFVNIVNSIKEFANEYFSLKVTIDEIEEGLLSFLRDHDLAILFASKDKSLLPTVKKKNTIKYIINKFMLYANEKEPQLFKFLLDISIGHALSGVILYSEFNSYSGKLKNLNIYLDTPIILNLLGLHGPYKKKATEELVRTLHEEGVNLFILETTKGEVNSILSEARKWLDKGSFDIEKASKVLRFCYRNSISASDIEQKIIKFDKFLSEYHISQTSVPHYEEKKYVIDEEKLKKTIYKVYKSVIKDFDVESAEYKGTIDRDIKVLSGIYRFRKGHKPVSIKDSRALFITSNTALAFASRVFETEQSGNNSTIPTCLTDVFLGTIIWLQSPQKVVKINKKRLLADCYSAIQPSEGLIKKYFDEIEKLKSENKISNDDYYLLRSHRVALNLLEEKTMGDPDAIDTTTTEEILDEIIKTIKNEETRKLIQEKEKHLQTKKELEETKSSKDQLFEKQKEKSKKIARIIWRIIFIFLIICMMILLIINTFPLLKLSKIQKIIYWILFFILSLLNLTTGFNIKSMKKKILKWIEKKYTRFYSNNRRLTKAIRNAGKVLNMNIIALNK